MRSCGEPDAEGLGPTAPATFARVDVDARELG
jgi:hypothetical protein